MFQTEKEIAQFIASQFPAFYREEGEDLVQFVKHYYEYLESEGPISGSRNLPSNRDVETTMDSMLKYFQNKYMAGLPTKVLGDTRELQQHILDLYRSKGSEAGLKLFFRLLYDEDISTYIPSYDILKTSDGIWVKNFYIEVTNSDINPTFQDKLIRGLNSGATGVVDSYQRRLINERNVNIFFLTNIQGEFEKGEIVFYEGADPLLCPAILGSPTGFVVNGSISGTLLGDIVDASDSSTSGSKGLQGIVSETFEGGGIIEFKIENGGSGYSNNLNISITAGSNTTGSGASFIVTEFSNTSLFEYNLNFIGDYENIQLDAANYSSGGGDTTGMATANLNTVIGDALQFEVIEIGTIEKIRTTNPGQNYDGNLTVEVNDPTTARLQISDGAGSILGNNAVITGMAVLGSIVTDVRVLDSGFGYNDPLRNITLVNQSNNDLTITATPVLSAVGADSGRWYTSQGFLNSDKYIQDSFYYQEYSYEIKSSRSLDKYIDVLRKLVHPSGNEVFSRAEDLNIVEMTPKLESFEVLTYSTTDSLTYSADFDQTGAIVTQDYIDPDYYQTDYVGESRDLS